MKKAILFLSFLCLSILTSLSAQDATTLAQINTDISASFTKAYQTLNYELFASLHSENLTRVSGNQGKIKNYDEYVETYRTWWTSEDVKGMEISFRFLERFCNESRASERGIYQLIINPGTKKEQAHYGKFHVIGAKEKGKWKILVDYDSSEGETISQASYEAAFAIDDFEKYTKK